MGYSQRAGTRLLRNWQVTGQRMMRTALSGAAKGLLSLCALPPLPQAAAEPVTDWVGLRPGRTRVRLELASITPPSTPSK